MLNSPHDVDTLLKTLKKFADCFANQFPAGTVPKDLQEVVETLDRLAAAPAAAPSPPSRARRGERGL
jgi:hypothetical protein